MMDASFGRLAALKTDRRAVTALEYGINAGALAFVLIAVFANLSTPISAALANVGSSI